MRIIGVESWNDDTIEPREGMKHLLSFLVNNIEGLDLYHRLLQTPTELDYVIKKAPVKPNSLLYIASHGRPNFVKLGNKSEFDVYLSDLATSMGKRYKGCGVHFASCAVLSSPKKEIQDFVDATDVAFVSGYKKYVDFGESSLMDMALINRWAWSTYHRPMFKKLTRDYKYMVEINGFSYYLKT